MLLLESVLAIFISLICSSYAMMPSGYSDYYTRYKIWPLSKSFVDQSDPNNITTYLNRCFDNATFYKHVSLSCDMFKPNNSAINCTSSAFVSHDDQAIILVYHFSVGMPEVNEQLQFYNTTVTFPGGGTIHKFYYNGILTLWNGGIRDAFFAAKNAYPTYELWVVGWSLGGALSTTSAAYISQMGYFNAQKIKLVTFGEPRVGHTDFANRFDSLVPYAYRVVHRNDIVPHLIPLSAGYTSHKNEIWYNNTMAEGEPYIECDTFESTNCSDSVPSNLWTWDDHPCFQDSFTCKKFSTI